ncbi:hypothetical protein KCU77_g61, partial [Aureobasidium melanogenum]
MVTKADEVGYIVTIALSISFLRPERVIARMFLKSGSCPEKGSIVVQIAAGTRFQSHNTTNQTTKNKVSQKAKEGRSKRDPHDPKQTSNCHTQFLLLRQIQPLYLPQWQQGPCLANGRADKDTGKNNGSTPHDHRSDQNGSHKFEIVVLGEKTAVLVEDGKFDHGNAEWVLNDQPILKNCDLWVSRLRRVEWTRTYPGDDDQPIVKVETNAQEMSGEQAQSKEDSRKKDSKDGSNDELVGAIGGRDGVR